MAIVNNSAPKKSAYHWPRNIQEEQLAWPYAWVRVPASQRVAGLEDSYGFAEARLYVRNQLRLLGASDVLISTGVTLMPDGYPRTGAESRAEKQDPGAAIYFTLDNKPYVIACDDWDKPKDNLRTIATVIGYLRAMKRAGGPSLMTRAMLAYQFTGQSATDPNTYRVHHPEFETQDAKTSGARKRTRATEQAPEYADYKNISSANGWWHLLQVASTAPLSVIEAAFRALARDAHPDKGGDEAHMARLTEAVASARAARNAAEDASERE